MHGTGELLLDRVNPKSPLPSHSTVHCRAKLLSTISGGLHKELGEDAPRL